MVRLVPLALIVTAAGCRGVLGIEDVTVASDASIDAATAVDAMPDVPNEICYGTFQPICFAQAPASTLVLTGTIDTYHGRDQRI